MNKYDVIVVGAGAAGATAAYFLGAGGARVLVIDKATLPRYKPCGGAVPRATYEHFPFEFHSVIDCESSHVTYCWQAAQAVTYPLENRSITMVMRDRFDWHILNHAPATLWDGTRVQAVEETERETRVTTDTGDVVTADYLVAADGAASWIAKSVGLRGKRVLTATIEAEISPAEATFERYAGKALFDFGALRCGYLWIFAKRDHLSIGVAQLKGRSGGLRQLMLREMRRLGVTPGKMQLRGHTLPVYQGPEQRATKRVLLVGDAAGLVDPLSGEGIRHGVASGRLAAQAILGQRGNHYTAWINRYANRTLRPMIILANLYYHYPWICFRYGVRNPRATRLLADWLNGRVSKAKVMAGLAFCLIEGIAKR